MWISKLRDQADSTRNSKDPTVYIEICNREYGYPTFTLTWNNGKVCTIKKSYCHDRKKYEEMKRVNIYRNIFFKNVKLTPTLFSL